MAYRQKKKNLFSKIMIWFLVFAMLASFIGTLVYYLFR
jgi:Na+/H+-dicarboxylate symporter